MNYIDKQITKDDLKKGNVIIKKIDPRITLLLMGYEEKLIAYRNLFQSYINKTINEFNDFDEEKFHQNYYNLKKQIEIVNKLILQGMFGDLFKYLNMNYRYHYQVDHITNCMVVEILN